MFILSDFARRKVKGYKRKTKTGKVISVKEYTTDNNIQVSGKETIVPIRDGITTSVNQVQKPYSVVKYETIDSPIRKIERSTMTYKNVVSPTAALINSLARSARVTAKVSQANGRDRVSGARNVVGLGRDIKLLTQ